MTAPRKIKNALISVYYKDHLEPIIKQLAELQVRIFSTGGTEKFIRDMGVDVVPVEDLTSYPSILGGRVKTLHPKIFGGILSRRENETDLKQLQEFDIPEIDLVIVDLYPFEETVQSGASEQEIIEKIDIGGISLIRAAAKNFKDVLIVSSKNDYAYLLDLLKEGKGSSSLEQRVELAKRAFQTSSHYDSCIYKYFDPKNSGGVLKISETQSQVLRYGENPHQQGIFYGNLDAMFDKLHGKEVSYNNLVDIDAAVSLIDEFKEATFAILKHTNACGVASATTILEAWNKALAADPVSAFGGVLITNRKVDLATASEINKLFFEVIIAPGFDTDALQVLQEKKNRIILSRKPVTMSTKQIKTLLHGFIEQDKDLSTETKSEMKVATESSPTDSQYRDLEFALKVVKHTKSNTIVLAKAEQLLASGVGQTSRVDALKQAILKAKSFGFDLQGAVMASDAFFPFPDCVEIATQAGILAIVQPGGSIKDKDSIDFCNLHKIPMVFTGVRHFKH